MYLFTAHGPKDDRHVDGGSQVGGEVQLEVLLEPADVERQAVPGRGVQHVAHHAPAMLERRLRAALGDSHVLQASAPVWVLPGPFKLESKLFIYLFIEGLYIAQSTAQGHLRVTISNLTQVKYNTKLRDGTTKKWKKPEKKLGSRLKLVKGFLHFMLKKYPISCHFGGSKISLEKKH